jgi:hypothetical protein
MAGSIKWFEYTTDNGDVFAIELDESNTEAINGTTGDYVAASTQIYARPTNVTPRSLYYSNADKTRTIKCVALTQAIYTDAFTNTRTLADPIDDGETLTLVRQRPEVIRLPYPQDTGLQDGDDD